MKHQALATIHFTGESRAGLPFLVTAKLSTDEPASCGQWGLAVEPVKYLSETDEASEIEAFVAFISEAAPKEVLRPGEQFDLYYGFKQVGYAVIKTGILPALEVRADVPPAVSKMMGDRPVRWAPPEKLIGDYDGRERTLQVFNAAAKDQLGLLKALRPIREQIQKAAGGSLVIIFHSPEQSAERYSDFLATYAASITPELR